MTFPSKTPHAVNERILVLAPTGRDAELAAHALSEGGFHAVICRSMPELCAHVREGAGAAMITEEALPVRNVRSLREALDEQPAWADLPLLLFTSAPAAEVWPLSFDALGRRANITLIERPIRVKTMISAVEAALRARRRQYEVRDLLGELERRLDERDQFLAMLSHELRNPLAAISLALSGTDDGTLSDQAILVRQTRHLTKLVDDLLDIGRVTSNKIVLHRTAVDLADIVEHCIATMKPRMEQRQLQVELHANVPHAMLSADTVRLEQVVNNLLSNAIKYTPEGGKIDVYLDRDGSDAVLRVRDSGKGIPPELIARIFDLFMQGEVAIDRGDGGMGIGLTLVRKLVELHGGSVHASSSGRGQGSEFVVRLPLQAQTESPARPPARPPAEAPVTPRHIMVVEDNPDVRELLRIKLRQLGHKVETAEDGLKGVERVLASRPEVAFVDIGLPGIDGYEVARRIRAEIGPAMLLVALTGYGQSEDRKRALDAGFDVHLTKPADVAELQRVLR